MMNILELPEDCLSQILSLTSPKDVLRSSAVSKQFLLASVSNTVWENFLPSYIVSRSSSFNSDQFASRKELFRYISHFPILLDNGTKSLALEKRCGKIWYMLGARALSILRGDNPRYWSWESVAGSRFPECAVLKDVCSLEIKGKIHTTLLSPGVVYGAYFVYKTIDFPINDLTTRVKASVSEVNEDGSLRDVHDHFILINRYQLEASSRILLWRVNLPLEKPVVRDDGWMEIEMGRCQVGVLGKRQGDRDRVVLEMTLKGFGFNDRKNGLVVHGVELRPLGLDELFD